MSDTSDDPDPWAFLPDLPEERRAVAANALELLGARFGLGPHLEQQMGELLSVSKGAVQLRSLRSPARHKAH